MKIIKIFLSLIIVLMLSFSNSFAIYDSSSTTKNNGYKDAILDNSITFKATRDGKYVKMSWSKYTGSNFQYYKLIRSETLENPVYPDNGYIKAISNSSEVEAKFENASEKSAVYRVCVITTDKDRYCSKTVKLEGYKNTSSNESSDDNSSDDDSTYKNSSSNNTKTETKNYQISDSAKKSADQLVAKFAINIDKKLSNDSDKIKAYENIISKLENLASTNSNLKNLVNYIIDQLKQKKLRYTDGFSEIEKIFEEAE